MGKNNYPKPKPPKKGPVNPNPNPQPAGAADFWFPANDTVRTGSPPASLGPTTLIIQKDNGTFWRVSEDKPPYTWTQIDTGSGGDGKKDPYKTIYPTGTGDQPLNAWERAWDESGGRTYVLPDLEHGDSFEIVDVYQQFANSPVTIRRNGADHFQFMIGKKYIGPDGQEHGYDPAVDSIILDVIGEGSVWRFSVIDSGIVAVVVPTISGE